MPERTGLEMCPPLPTLDPRHRAYLKTLAGLFDVDGAKGDEKVTEGQLVIFGAIVLRLNDRIQVICSTQYGKSLWVALACIVLSCVFGKTVVVVAPSKEKAKIIMRYYVDHLGDHPLFSSRLEKGSRLDRLRQEESKERIKLNNGGGIFVISTDEKNSRKSIEAAMGEGAEIVIGDEFCLVSDNTEATIYRMIAGKGPGACYVKIGNPFYAAPPNGHFLRSWLQAGRYLRIFIDWRTALAEGRYTGEFLAEARKKPMFDVLYGSLFPDLSVMGADGYMPLLTPEKVKFGVTPEIILAAMENAKARDGCLRVRPKLGCDIGAGGDPSVRVLRWGKMAAVTGTNENPDTMSNVPLIIADMGKYGVLAPDVNVDDIGVGRGVSDRLKELGHAVNAVSVGDPAAFDPDRFSNLRAELAWAMALWVAEDETRLDARDEWVQLTWLRYKTQSDRKVILEPKSEVRSRNGRSPDHADSLCLTFAESPFVGFV